MRGIQVTFSPSGGVCFWKVAWQKDASIFKRLSVMILFATAFKFLGVTRPGLSLSLSYFMTYSLCKRYSAFVLRWINMFVIWGAMFPRRNPQRPPWICIYRAAREPTALKLIISIQMQKQYFNDAFAWKAILFELVSGSSIISEYISPLWNLGWAYCEKEKLLRWKYYLCVYYICVCPRLRKLLAMVSIICNKFVINWSCKYFNILCSNDI